MTITSIEALKCEVCKINAPQYFLVRSTRSSIEIKLKMGETLEKICENAILNHKCNYKKWLCDQNYEHRGRSTS